MRLAIMRLAHTRIMTIIHTRFVQHNDCSVQNDCFCIWDISRLGPTSREFPVAMALSIVASVETPVRVRATKTSAASACADDFNETPVKHAKPRPKQVKLDGKAAKVKVRPEARGAMAAVPAVPSFEDDRARSSKSTMTKRQTQSERLSEKSLVNLANTSLKPISEMRSSQRQIIHGWW